MHLPLASPTVVLIVMRSGRSSNRPSTAIPPDEELIERIDEVLEWLCEERLKTR